MEHPHEVKIQGIVSASALPQNAISVEIAADGTKRPSSRRRAPRVIALGISALLIFSMGLLAGYSLRGLDFLSQKTQNTPEGVSTISSSALAPAASGDTIVAEDLLGEWKLVSFEVDGKRTTGDAALSSETEARYYAYYWVDFSETNATFTAIPEKGNPDLMMTGTYAIEGERITFAGSNELLFVWALLDDGKLLISRDISDDEDGSRIALCVFEKQ